MGKMNPDKQDGGNISPSMLMNMATCWVFALVEINTPSDSARVM